jgi:hypothetical protein
MKDAKIQRNYIYMLQFISYQLVSNDGSYNHTAFSLDTYY